MADSCNDKADIRAPPTSCGGPSQPRVATMSGNVLGDYGNIHMGDRNVHVGQLNHSVNNYTYPPPQAGGNATSDSRLDEPIWLVPFGRNRDFVGRGPILERLLNMISPNADEDDCQQTVISGLGGVGKTQIALEAAFQVRGKFKDCHVFWVPALNATTFENAYREIGRQLKITEPDGNTGDIKLLVKAALGQTAKQWLLIIDNADDIALFSGITKATPLSDYLPFNLKGSILFTTRNDEVSQLLGIRRENVLYITEMSRPEATDMLQKGLLPYQISNAQSSIESLLDFLTDLPLAIKQASAYMIKTGMVVSKYLDYCRSSDEHLIELLSKDFNDRARYKSIHNPVAATWLISFEAISRDNPLAAEYLQFMAFLAEKDIPRHLLPPTDDELGACEAIGMLKAYAFISERADGNTYDTHRLVRLVMQNWLRKEGLLQTCITTVMQQLNTIFPRLDNGDKTAWARYLPHAIIALKFHDYSLNQVLSSRLLSKAALGLHHLGKSTDAKQISEQALALQTKVLGPEHPETLVIMHDHIMIALRQGQYKEAEQIGQKVVNLRRKVLGPEHPETLISINDFTKALQSQGKYQEAKQINQQTLELCRKILGAEHPSTIESMRTLALVIYWQGGYQEAEKLNRQVLELLIKLKGPEHPDISTTMKHLAVAVESQGRSQEAEQIYRQTLEMRKKTLELEHPAIIISMSNLASVIYCQGQFQEAEKIFQQVLKQLIKVSGPKHPNTLAAMNNLAIAVESQGRYQEAEQIHRQTLELRKQILEPEHPDIIASMSNFASVICVQGQFQEAELINRQVLDAKMKTTGPEHPDTLTVMNNLALSLYYQGKYQEAEQIIQQVFNLRIKVLGPGHPDTLESLSTVSMAVKRQGRYRETEKVNQLLYELQAKVLGPEHPETIASMKRISKAYVVEYRIRRKILQLWAVIFGK